MNYPIEAGVFVAASRMEETLRAEPKVLNPDEKEDNFVELFSDALHGQPFTELSKPEQKALIKRFEFKVSDYMPIWLRLPLP